jgi:SAM-dependent MidA family methyltransferase
MDEVKSIIRQEILSGGSISFARFMELALYCPKIGYYERASTVLGRQGDFYTAVSTGPLFGELLARQFANWCGQSGLPTLTLVEGGAHDGRLAADVLGWLREFRSGLSVNYIIIEPSEQHRAWQRSRLELFAGQVSWFGSFGDLLKPVQGVIFCNELLDAMPVHILQWKSGRWVEMRVTIKDEHLAWDTADLTTDIGQPESPARLAALLPEGFRIEVSPAARAWWQSAAAKLERGKLVAVDYGLEQQEFLAPHRSEGTLRAYYRHHIVNDPLARPGQQDLTAHVNFAEIQRAGELGGLRTEALLPQSTFLTEIGATISNWTPERVRQFQTLTHPEHLGRSFKMLIQSR